MGLVSGYYDRFWSADVRPDFSLPAELEGLIRKSIEPGLECLDIGCGAGRTYAQWLAPEALRYVGVDVSEKAVALAREAGMDSRVISDAAELPFGDECFDAAICIEVFEHLFEPHSAAAEIARVLRPGGCLIASVPNMAYWRMRVNSALGLWNPAGDALAMEQPWRDPHIRFFTMSALAHMLRGSGFSRVELGACGGCFFDHASSRATNFGTSRGYRFLEKRVPSLLGMTLYAVATR